MKIGILGGSFDPVHEGHLYLARTALEIFDLEQVMLMIAKSPPHKQDIQLTSALHRYAMVVLATQNDPEISAGAWELEQPGPSYTIRTLEHFQRDRPGDDFVFIGGADSLKELHLWKDYGRLLTEFSLVFFHRVGTVDTPVLPEGRLRTVCENERHRIEIGTSYLVRSSPPAISSTTIRNLLASGKTPANLPLPVLHYIEKYGLYERNEEHARPSLPSNRGQEG